MASGRDIDGGYATDFRYRRRATIERLAKRQKGLCINGPKHGGPSRSGRVHGPPNQTSGKCDECDRIAAQARSKPRRAA